MTRGFSTTIVAALLILPAAIAWGLPRINLTLQPESRLWVNGTSTVRDYECTAKDVSAVVAANGAEVPSAVLAGQKAVTSVAVTIAARELDCSNGTMNGHMLKAIKAADHPNITFRLSSYDLTPSGVEARARLTGTLELGGISRPVTIDAAASDGGDGALRVSGSHDLLMTEFGLRPPSLMLGTMKVRDKVTVNFDLYLKG